MKIGTLLNSFSITFCKLGNKLRFTRKKVSLGSNVSIEGKVYIFGHKQSLQIGSDGRIISFFKLNPIVPYMGYTMFNTFEEGKITIGNGVGITMSAFAARESITVEDEVYIGAGCRIYDNDFHALRYEDRIINKDRDIEIKPVLIKKGAFIGAESIILKGVTIGEKSVVGAGSVVTKSIPDGEIWGGNPAVFIRKID